jgi:hypothetical protein
MFSYQSVQDEIRFHLSKAMRPQDFMLPVVGAVTLDNILTALIFPRHSYLYPKTSPRSTSKLMSWSAQT